MKAKKKRKSKAKADENEITWGRTEKWWSSYHHACESLVPYISADTLNTAPFELLKTAIEGGSLLMINAIALDRSIGVIPVIESGWSTRQFQWNFRLIVEFMDRLNGYDPTNLERTRKQAATMFEWQPNPGVRQ